MTLIPIDIEGPVSYQEPRSQPSRTERIVVPVPLPATIKQQPQPKVEAFNSLAMIKPAFNYDVPVETPVENVREKAVEIAEQRKHRPKVVTLKPTAIQRKQYEWDQEWG